jgi:uncharacterized protein YcbK (DUF882 family)
MRNLRTATTLAAMLGLALFATCGPAAAARSDGARAERHAAGHHHQRRAAKHRHKTYGSRRSSRRTASRHHSRTVRSAGAGTSRSCLTSQARALLGRIEGRFGRVQIVSTCRPGARIAGSGRPSKHASGQAIDFNAPSGRKGEVVRWLIANHRSGGTMTYRGMSHIHVDVGYHFVSLNSRSGG